MATSIFRRRLCAFARTVRKSAMGRRLSTDENCGEEKKGLILGYYLSETGEPVLTKTAAKVNDHLNGRVVETLRRCHTNLHKGDAFVVSNFDNEFWSVAFCNLGGEKLGYNENENIDEGLEAVRMAAGMGVQEMKDKGITRLLVEGLGHPEQAAEGSALALWSYQENRSRQNWRVVPTLELFEDCDADSFQRGLFKAESQNLARRLSDTPANQMTPLHFAQEAVNELCPCGVKVMIHDKDWIESKKMNAFLTVTRGSCEPPVFIEISYCNGPMDQKPIVMVGKGITFGSGGVCLKKCEGMDVHRADMSGAAAVIATIRAASALSLPMNIEGCLAVCENMPSGMAMKCGDVITSLNGKSIMITDTDNEGRMTMADAIMYGESNHKPNLIMNVGSLAKGVMSALGGSACGVFSNNHNLWSQVEKAGAVSGDRVWRFPVWDYFSKKVNGFADHDVNNKGTGHATSCLGAAFLKEFIRCADWLAFDTTGAGMRANNKIFPYLTQGRMTGRPTRTLIQFLHQLACSNEYDDRNRKK